MLQLSFFNLTTLSNLRIKKKINVLVMSNSFLAGIAIMAGLIGMLLAFLSIQSLHRDAISPLEHLRLIKQYYEHDVLAKTRMVIEGERVFDGSQYSVKSDFDGAYKSVTQAKLHIEHEWKAYTNASLTSQEKKLLPESQEYMKRSLKSLDDLAVALQEKNFGEIMTSLESDMPYTVKVLLPKLDNLMSIQIIHAGELYEIARDEFFITLGIILFSLAFGSFIVMKIVNRIEKTITEPIHTLVEQSALLANSKLDEPFLWDRNDELGHLGQSFELTRQKLFTLFSELHQSNTHLAEIHHVVKSSINYASRIQRSFLPDEQDLLSLSDDAFVIWRPKDTIGGDCYWVDKTEKGFFVAVIDCTGHGVPGALMTFIAISFLDRLLQQHRHLEDPAWLLGSMNRMIKEALGQFDESSESNDGMDGAFCFVDTQQQKITYAGANIALLYHKDGHMHHIQPDKASCGYVHCNPEFEFHNHTLMYEKGMSFFITTDGLTDQIGGNKRIAFGRKRLMETLHENIHYAMNQQKEFFLSRYDFYKGDESQRDDNTMIGFKL